ncbi:Hypothetical predicted protein [Pelobates cultripes]|uniref:Uncharacterized protein n=2 Tax=Pelobates cultripes TaxID=61616 RepID=A0AAD1R7Z1_PELCU|nr:Hypothetical predicted protein [Pelobates cultripes]
MGRTKRAQMTPSTPRTQGNNPHPSIRSYLHTPGDLLTQEELSNMAPSSPSSTLSEEVPNTGTNGTAAPAPDWYALYASLPKKEDFHSLLEEVKTTLHTEISALGSSITALETRVQALESRRPDLPCPALAATTAQAKQIQDLRLHIEDLDNRSRRHNIRVRGCRETDPPEDTRAILTPLFNRILNRPRDARIPIDRAHRALKPKPPPGAPPRDIICHIPDFQLKEEIMRKARTERSWRHEGQTVELYNDLSHLTLQARRALRPLTTAMQEAQIRYRWQFPFALTARRDDTEATIRSPQDVQAFQEALGLPQMPIADWTNCPMNERFTGRPTRRHIQQGPNAEFTSLQQASPEE